jgi:hypothetical protein
VAKPVTYSSGKEPSKWAIVLVALLLILLPSLFCGIILYTSSTGQQQTGAGIEFKKRDGGGGGGGGGGGP